MSKIGHISYNSALLQQTVSVCSQYGLTDLLYLFSYTFLPFIAISWPIEAVHLCTMSYYCARKHSLVYNVPSATVTVRYDIKICNWKF